MSENVLPMISPNININLKWLKDLNMRHDTIKLLKDNIFLTQKAVMEKNRK